MTCSSFHSIGFLCEGERYTVSGVMHLDPYSHSTSFPKEGENYRLQHRSVKDYVAIQLVSHRGGVPNVSPAQ